MKTPTARIAAMLTSAAVCLAVAIAIEPVTGSAAASATAVAHPRRLPDPFASVGMAKDSYTAARTAFVISLDARAGLASYDVRISDSSMVARHRAAWVRPSRLQALPATDPDATPRLTRHVGRGRVKCVSVRARDVTGTTGAWSHGSCAIRALDDAALGSHGPHRIVRNARYWGGRASEIGKRGRLVLHRVPKGSRVTVLVTNLNQNELRYNGRGLSFTIPSKRSVFRYSVGGVFAPTEYTVDEATREFTGRFGPVTFHGKPVGQSYKWTSPLEGVAIRPPWV